MFTRVLSIYMLLSCFLVLESCKEELVVVQSTVPDQEERVSQATLDQYIFRLYIDLLGQAPDEATLATRTSSLRENNLQFDARNALILELQTSPATQEAYALNLYQGAKTRFLENFPDAEIQRQFVGQGSTDDDQRLLDLLQWQQNYLAGQANLFDLQKTCVYNLVYDQINMGSFNLVRASFDNLLWRYPSDEEFEAGFSMVDANASEMLFGFSGSSKTDFIEIVTSSDEAVEGIVIWQYDQLLARRPTAAETLSHLDALRETGNLLELQQAIMQTNEYAGF